MIHLSPAQLRKFVGKAAPMIARGAEPRVCLSTLRLLTACENRKLPMPEQEWRFHHERRWRFDFAWPGHKVAVECEGGAWSGGRHTRGKGFIGDLEKYNAAAADGWTVLRYTPQALGRDGCMEQIAAVLKQRECVK